MKLSEQIAQILELDAEQQFNEHPTEWYYRNIIRTLTSVNEKLREGLEFYANPKTYSEPHGECGLTNIFIDEGKNAALALEITAALLEKGV